MGGSQGVMRRMIVIGFTHIESVGVSSGSWHAVVKKPETPGRLRSVKSIKSIHFELNQR